MADLMDRWSDELSAWRRDFHQHPELGFEEHRTSDKVAERLESFGLKVTRGVGGTGVIGTLQRGDGGPASAEHSIALRADMDALPISEQTGVEHSSRHPGVMHACGHDGHTTMLLGAARYLAAEGKFRGCVHFVFQPAEEGLGGAEAMLKDGLFERFPAHKVFGMHNWPGKTSGDFGIRSGPLLAAADFVEYSVLGKGGHAALPEETVDPVLIAAHVLVALQGIVARNVSPLQSAVLSITQVHGGDAKNVIPDRVDCAGCVRTFSPEVRQLIEQQAEAIVRNTCAAHGASSEWRWERKFETTINHQQETQESVDAARALGHPVDTDVAPMMGSEDFSFMLQQRPGSFILIGNGDSAGLHSPHYDFNDEILSTGARYWVRLVEQLLPA